MTLVFSTKDRRYAWLNGILGVVDGEFDERAGRAAWKVFVPAS